MTEKFKINTPTEEADVLARKLPSGVAWNAKWREDSNFRKLLIAIGLEYIRRQQDANEIYNELHLSTTNKLIDEWVNDYGIQNSCFKDYTGTLEDAIEAIRISIQANGTSTKDQFESLAGLLGLDIFVYAGEDYPLYTYKTKKHQRFTMIVDLARVLESEGFPYTFPFVFQISQSEVVKCLFKTLKPANVEIAFVNEGTYSLDLVIDNPLQLDFYNKELEDNDTNQTVYSTDSTQIVNDYEGLSKEVINTIPKLDGLNVKNNAYFDGESFLSYLSDDSNLGTDDFTISINGNSETPKLYMPSNTDLVNKGTSTNIITYISTSRQSVVDFEGTPREIDEGIEVIDGTEVQTVGEFFGGDALNFSNPPELDIADEFYLKAENITFKSGVVNTIYERWLAPSDIAIRTGIDDIGRLFAIFTGSGDLTQYKQYRTPMSINAYDTVEVVFNSNESGDILKLFVNGVYVTPDKPRDDTFYSIANITADNLVAGSGSTRLIGTCCCLTIKSAGTEVLNIPFQGNFEDQPTNNRESLPVTVVGQPTLLGVGHLSGENSKGYAPQEGNVENLVVDSEEPSDQSPTVLNATEYTLSCGEGEIIASGFGSAFPDTPLTFTTTSTIVALLFVGTTKYVNLELGNKVTRWIPTHGSSYTRKETENYFQPSGVIDSSKGKIETKVIFKEDDSEEYVAFNDDGFYIKRNTSGMLEVSSDGPIIDTGIKLKSSTNILFQWDGLDFTVSTNSGAYTGVLGSSMTLTTPIFIGSDSSYENTCQNVKNFKVY